MKILVKVQLNLPNELKALIVTNFLLSIFETTLAGTTLFLFMPLAVKVLASVYLGAQRVPTRYSCCIIFASAITRERCFDIFSLDSAPQATSA